MAKKSSVAKNNKRKRMVEQYKVQRAELKAIWLDSKRTDEEREAAHRKLCSMPTNSSAVRVRNRCALTGRPRGYYRKFGLSRIAVRDGALRGDLPGVIKASW